MIYKRCSRCGKRIEVSSKCSCYNARHKEYKKYRKDTREDKFYSSREWTKTRDIAKAKYNGIDIYSYYVLKRVEHGQTIHHIEEIKDNWDRRLDIDNLIYLTESNHQLIHKMYKENKKDTMNLLFSLIKRWESET